MAREIKKSRDQVQGDQSLLLKICDRIAKYSIFATIFLVPIFFLPWTADVLDFNKQILMLVLVFISVFAFLAKTMISGKFEIKKSPVHIFAGIFLIIYFLTTVFSYSRSGSFWGQSQQISESMLAMVCFILFYFLISNFFSKKEILISAIILCFSAILAELIGIFQLFGLFIIPFSFAKSSAFSTVGSVGSLGMFSAILFPLSMILLVVIKKWWRILFAIQMIVSMLVLILVDYPIIWWVVIIGSALMIILGTLKNDLFDGKWMALPMFFLAVSLFFVLLNLNISWLPQKTNEIFLSQRAGFNIGMQSLRENPILGSGPGTFAYDFSKFKNSDFSKSSLWSVTFNKSSSKILNTLTTTGVLGFLGFASFVGFIIFYSLKFLFAKKKPSEIAEFEGSENGIYLVLVLGLTVILIEQTLSYFLYNSNMTLELLYFFVIAALAGIIPAKTKEYSLKSSAFINLAATLVFTLVFIFGIGLFVLGGQRYAAEVSYYQALVAYQNNKTPDGLKKLESAAGLNQNSDLYFRQLAQAYLMELQNEIQKVSSTPDDQQKAKIQALISNSINAAKIATDIDPNNVSNWALRGYIYQSLFGVFEESSQWAITSYDSALKLDPYNPYLFAQEGNVYLVQSLALSSDKNDEKNQLLNQAKEKLERAVELNPNYANALYSLGLVYDNLGQKDKSIEQFKKVQSLNPDEKSIQQILDNLNSGKPALQSASPVTETPPEESKSSVENPPASKGSDTPKK